MRISLECHPRYYVLRELDSNAFGLLEVADPDWKLLPSNYEVVSVPFVVAYIDVSWRYFSVKVESECYSTPRKLCS